MKAKRTAKPERQLKKMKRRRLKRIGRTLEQPRVLWVRELRSIKGRDPTIPEVRAAFPRDSRAKTTACRIGRKTKT